MEILKVALLTSTSLRHKYVAYELSKSLDVKLIITEEKSKSITDISEYNNKKDLELINGHFLNRNLSEEKYFGHVKTVNSEIARHLKYGEMNSTEVQKLLLESKVDYILLFGTSIIKEKILEQFPSRIINFHLGLSPYYKGSATNFWPVVNNEFSCIGGTFHLASKQVDGGDILHQFRPEFNPEDTIHDLGNKVIKKGAELFGRVINDYHNKKINIVKQEYLVNSKIYKVKDFGPKPLKTAIENLERGNLNRYLDNKSNFDMMSPIHSTL